MAKKIQLQDANGNVLHPLTLGECVAMDNGENLDTLMSKSQMFTPTITQDKSMFKVGTGVDVDYSANVKDGAYESLVFKGKSLVNLWKKHDTHNQRNFTLYEDGFMETVPNVLYFDHIQKANTGMIKPNTKYLLIVEVVKNTLPVPISFQSDNRTYFYGNSGMMFGAGETGVVKKIITSISDLSTTRDDLRWGAYIQFAQDNVSESERGVVKIRQMLIEYQQGMENWDIPYFTGICDSKMPILRNVGKNLLTREYALNSATLVEETNEYVMTKGSGNIAGGLVFAPNLIPNKTYSFSVTAKTNRTDDGAIRIYNDTRKEYINVYLAGLTTQAQKVGGVFTVPSTHQMGDEFKIWIGKNIAYDLETTFTIYKDWQLEESSSITTHEDHKTNILRTSEEIVLRSLPNGVCDTYNARTGEYVKRIGERTLNGSEAWIANSGTDKQFEDVWVFHNQESLCNGTVRLCDKLQARENANENAEFIRGGGAYIFVYISKNKVQNHNANDFKTWLQSNPITVQYELAEPVTTIVKPSTTTPFAYQNGHVILESGFEGQSLLPEIEYSVVTGRTGQVTQNTKVLRQQEQQIIGLEELLLTQIVQMEYERTLLQFDYELQMMMLG